MSKTIKFNITPQTNVRATKGDSIFFRIPRDKLYPSGLKRLLRLEKYNDYKDSLRSIAERLQFAIPEQGMNITFYIPMPKSWKPWQKEVMNSTLHRSKPDIDNLTKAFFDAILKEDKKIGHLSSISKIWTNKEKGWIEVRIDQPKIKAQEFPKKQKDMYL